MSVEKLNRTNTRGLRRKLRNLNQRGDTLIEVTFALMILAAVLVSSSMLVVKGLQTAHTGQERTQLADEAQRQMEGLRSFRDNHSWTEFMTGRSGVYRGVLNGGGSTCRVATPCFHLDVQPTTAGVSEFVPLPNSIAGKVATSYMEIKATAVGGVPTNTVDVVLSYGFKNAGGGPDNVGHIKARYTNVNFNPTPTPCQDIPHDIILTLDTSLSMNDPWGANTAADELRVQALKFVNSTRVGPVNHEGIVGFSGGVTVYQPLTSDPNVLRSTINNLPAVFGTNYLPPLNRVAQIFSSNRPEAREILIFISDGEDQNGDIAGYEARAAQLKADGVQVYMIGINPDNLLLNEMRQMASPGGFVSAANPAQLKNVIDSIIDELSCGP